MFSFEVVHCRSDLVKVKEYKKAVVTLSIIVAPMKRTRNIFKINM